MKVKQYALDKGGPKRLKLSWVGIWKNIELRLDDVPLGDPLPDFKALKQGRTFRLPDGRTLELRWSTKVGGGGLELTLDGRPLEGAANDPREAIRNAAIILWVVAGLNLVVAFVLVAISQGDIRSGGELALLFAEPVAFAVLGYFVWKHHSRVALAIAIVLEIVGGAFIMAMLAEGGRVPTFGIVIRVLIVMALVRGYRAIGEAQRLARDELVDTFK